MAAIEKTLVEERVSDVARSPIIKTIIVGNDGRSRELSNSVDEDSRVRTSFSSAGALEPPYNATTLCELFEVSSALRQNVDAYATNIDGNGHHFEPVIDLDSDDVLERIANAIYIERLIARDEGNVVDRIVPTPEEIADRLSSIEDAMRLERFRFETFFETCTVEESFVSLRRKTRQDLEVTGNAFWEVLRDNRRRVAQFSYMQAHTVRLLPQRPEFVEIVLPTRVSPLSVRPETFKRRFRRFVQVIDQRKVYFKEHGDPRVMSSATGEFFASVDHLKSREPTASPATEILHFKIHSPKSPYGVPRWIGTLLGILGSRQAEEVNYLYFENKSVPPMALLVSGGRVTSDSVDALRDFISSEIKGKRNFHKILVIEGVPGSADDDPLAAGRMKIELKPLTQAQQSDALFQKYDERNADKTGMAFRLPRMLRGDIRDFNRSTAEAALEFAEAQVFGPERTDFDYIINRAVGESINIRFWKFRSNSIRVQDPKTMAEILERLSRAGIIVPADGRQLASQFIFNQDLPRIDADWAYQPVMLTQTGVPFDTARDGVIPEIPSEGGTGETPPSEEPPKQVQEAAKKAAKLLGRKTGRTKAREMSTVEFAHELIRIRDEMMKLELEDAREAHASAVKASDDDSDDVLRITMPVDEMVRRFGIVPTAAE